MTEDSRASIASNNITNLVIVAGHAIFLGSDLLHPLSDANWALLPFQESEASTYLSHVQVGVECASADPSSLLIFSGGQTRLQAGPRSEGQGYWNLADIYDWWGKPLIALRATTEEFARDSYENLLFSICRFHEWTGRYPTRISVVSWPFKAARFDAHRSALRFPEGRFKFLGYGEPSDVTAADSGEARTLASFAEDPFGTGMNNQRMQRNPFNRFNPYAMSCPELRTLLLDPGAAYSSAFPWGE